MGKKVWVRIDRVEQFVKLGYIEEERNNNGDLVLMSKEEENALQISKDEPVFKKEKKAKK